MTSQAKRPLLLTVLLLAILLLANGWSFSWMLRQRSAADAAAVDAAACQGLERLIADMRRQSTLVSAQSIESQELGERIDAAAKQSDLNLNLLQGVFPEPAVRVGNLPYVEKPTTLTFRKVEARTLATFLFHLTNSSGLTLRHLHLRTPHGNTGSTLWDVDATITCLVYAPNANSRGD
jgi:hypothetical protein